MPEISTIRRSAVMTLPWLAVGVVCAALLLALAGFGSRIGWWHFRTGFVLLQYGVYGGIGAAILAVLAGLVAGRQRRTDCILLSLVALFGGVAVTVVPVSWRIKAKQLSMIHDITTDTVHPPQFVAILPLRKNAPNPADYGGPAVAEQQKKSLFRPANRSAGSPLKPGLRTGPGCGTSYGLADSGRRSGNGEDRSK